MWFSEPVLVEVRSPGANVAGQVLTSVGSKLRCSVSSNTTEAIPTTQQKKNLRIKIKFLVLRLTN